MGSCKQLACTKRIDMTNIAARVSGIYEVDFDTLQAVSYTPQAVLTD